jgi:hypothetical protein
MDGNFVEFYVLLSKIKKKLIEFKPFKAPCKLVTLVPNAIGMWLMIRKNDMQFADVLKGSNSLKF